MCFYLDLCLSVSVFLSLSVSLCVCLSLSMSLCVSVSVTLSLSDQAAQSLTITFLGIAHPPFLFVAIAQLAPPAGSGLVAVPAARLDAAIAVLGAGAPARPHRPPPVHRGHCNRAFIVQMLLYVHRVLLNDITDCWGHGGSPGRPPRLSQQLLSSVTRKQQLNNNKSNKNKIPPPPPPQKKKAAATNHIQEKFIISFFVFFFLFFFACVCVCVRACVRACVRVCVF